MSNSIFCKSFTIFKGRSVKNLKFEKIAKDDLTSPDFTYLITAVYLQEKLFSNKEAYSFFIRKKEISAKKS